MECGARVVTTVVGEVMNFKTRDRKGWHTYKARHGEGGEVIFAGVDAAFRRNSDDGESLYIIPIETWLHHESNGHVYDVLPKVLKRFKI